MMPPSVTNSMLDPFGPVEDWSSLLSSRIAKIFASDSTGTKVALPVNMLHGIYYAMKRLEALFIEVQHSIVNISNFMKHL